MKFRCERDELSAALAAATRAVSSRPALSELSGVMVKLDEDGTLTVTGSDLDLTIAKSVTVNADEPGVALLPGRLTSDIVRAPPAAQAAIDKLLRRGIGANPEGPDATPEPAPGPAAESLALTGEAAG